MLIRIDPSVAAPLAEQVAAQIRGAIAAGRLHPRQRLPPARELAESLDINMHTVLRAYGQLRSEGLIELRPGRGATVRDTAGPAQARLVQAVHRLVAEGRQLGLTVDELVDEVRRHAS